MQLGSFCAHYPAEQDIWPRIRPSKALPPRLKEVLFPRLGIVLAAQDRSRNRTATRIGIALRPFQRGDRLSALSLPHLMRTGELMSRIDDAQGQVTARIVIVTEPSLDFRSEEAPCSKGQTLLGIAGVVEAIHTRQNHAVNLLFSSRADLAAQLGALAHKRQPGEALYLLSDFLYGTLEADARALSQVGYNKGTFFCVRDPLELPGPENPLFNQMMRLTPYSSPQSGPLATGSGGEDRGARFSGQDYLANLDAELRHYHRVVENGTDKGVTATGLFAAFTWNSAIHEVVRMVSRSDMICNNKRARARPA
jgi:hypothetical protein